MVESWLSAITAEGDEVGQSGVVETSKSVRHEKRLNPAGMHGVCFAHVGVPKRDANVGHKGSRDTWATGQGLLAAVSFWPSVGARGSVSFLLHHIRP